MDGSDEAQMQQDILKLQLHAIPLNLNIGQINEVESEDDGKILYDVEIKNWKVQKVNCFKNLWQALSLTTW